MSDEAGNLVDTLNSHVAQARTMCAENLVKELADAGWTVNVRGNGIGTYDGRALGHVRLENKYPSVAGESETVKGVYVWLWAKAKTLYPNGVQ